MLPVMKLQAYLAGKRITHRQFAELVGSTEFAVHKWVTGERIPRPKWMRVIAEKTGGIVTAKDFHDDGSSLIPVPTELVASGEDASHG